MFIPKDCTIAITLPASQKDTAIYRRWRELATELQLPLEFEAGLDHNLDELLGSSVCAISTSIKEGFGFSFLEPWTAGLDIYGRRIDYVCRDFENAGVKFESLYPALQFPLDHIEENPHEKIKTAIQRIYSAFGYETPVSVLQDLKTKFTDNKTIDFGRLDESMQETLIRKVHTDSKMRGTVLGLNPCLELLLDKKANNELIVSNRKVIAEQYGKERITNILLEIYREIINTSVIHKLSKPKLLELFLNPDNLFLTGISNE